MQARAEVDNSTTPRARPIELKGIVFQADARSAISRWFIRPFEDLDRWMAGLKPAFGRADPPLANHAGVHLVLEDGREVVLEQLVDSARHLFVSGLAMTPIEEFRRRDNGGWDLSIAATAFRGVDEAAIREALDRIPRLSGRPFYLEDCVDLVERAFGGRRLFADSPLLRRLHLPVRVEDPALPLLRPSADLDPGVARLIRAQTLRGLPDPATPAGHALPRMRHLRVGLGALALGLVVLSRRRQ